TDTYQLSDQWVKTGEKSNCNWWTLCIAQNYTMYFTQSEVNKEVKTNSMRANYGIGIDFIGQDQGAVNVTSNSSVAVTGNISNAHGSTAITATGDLTATDKGVIGGKNVNLQARSIGELAKAANVRVQGGTLNALATDGNVVIKNVFGSVNVGQISAVGSTLTNKGRVILSADGDIMGSASSLIQGERVELTATNGRI